MNNEFIQLATREGFNKTLRHFAHTISINDTLEARKSVSDNIYKLYSENSITQDQIAPIVNAILLSKFKCSYKSINIKTTYNDFENLAKITSGWTGVDITLLYHHPALGLSIANPKDVNQLKEMQSFRQDELVVLYCYSFIEDKEEDKKKIADLALNEILAIINNNVVQDAEKNYKKFIDTKKPEKSVVAAPVAKAPVKAAGTKKSTPQYAVQVSNELFHNGNVEAWKNIIESYTSVYKGNEVFVFYEGEAITDLNALFKWGKVKHAGLIFFQIVGSQIKGVSRLQKYLYEGASPRFENYLKKDVNKILRLF